MEIVYLLKNHFIRVMKLNGLNLKFKQIYILEFLSTMHDMCRKNGISIRTSTKNKTIEIGSPFLLKEYFVYVFIPVFMLLT